MTSICPNGGSSPNRAITVSPSRTTSALITASSTRERDGEPRGAREVRPDAGQHARADDRHRDGGQQQRVRRDERERHEREAVQRGDAGAGRVQRACAAPVHQRAPPAVIGTGTTVAPSTATA